MDIVNQPPADDTPTSPTGTDAPPAKSALMLEHFTHNLSLMQLGGSSARPSSDPQSQQQQQQTGPPPAFAGTPIFSLLDWTGREKQEDQEHHQHQLQERWKVLSMLPVPTRGLNVDESHMHSLWVCLDFLFALIARNDAQLISLLQTTLYRDAFADSHTTPIPFPSSSSSSPATSLPFPLATQARIAGALGDTAFVKPMLWARLADLPTIARFLVHEQWARFGLPDPSFSPLANSVVNNLAPGGCIAFRLCNVLRRHWNIYVNNMAAVLRECGPQVQRVQQRHPQRTPELALLQERLDRYQVFVNKMQAVLARPDVLLVAANHDTDA